MQQSGSNKDLSVHKQQQSLEHLRGKLAAEISAVNVEGQQSQNKCYFGRQIDGYYCDFAVTKQDTFKIVLNSALDAQIYQLELTKQQKKTTQDLNFFESIEEIFEYLQQNTAESTEQQNNKLVKIDQTGKISITVISTIGKKQRHRHIFLQARRVQENKQAYLEKLIKRISKNLVQLKSEVVSLKKKHQKFEDKSQQLLQRMKSQGQKLPFRCSKSDPHYQKFKFYQKKISKSLDDTSYFNLISETQILKSGVSYFSIKVLNSSTMNIIVGIGSKFIRGIANAYTHPDFIGLYLYGPGYIWEKTDQRQLNLKYHPITNGIVVNTIVDMDLGYICWQICKVRVAYAIIPQQLKAKMLLPVVMMMNVNDAIITP